MKTDEERYVTKYRVFIVSEAGDGVISSMDFDELEEIKLYTANIGRNCEITIGKIVLCVKCNNERLVCKC